MPSGKSVLLGGTFHGQLQSARWRWHWLELGTCQQNGEKLRPEKIDEKLEYSLALVVSWIFGVREILRMNLRQGQADGQRDSMVSKEVLRAGH